MISKVIEMTLPGVPSLLELFEYYPDVAVKRILNILNIMLNGVLFWLILKGTALGLCMLTETDLNYRSNVGGEDHE